MLRSAAVCGIWCRQEDSVVGRDTLSCISGGLGFRSVYIGSRHLRSQEFGSLANVC